ncbi:MAG: gliding motility-associated C-terminal domain-containing protein [Saprospiraceae bacterium]
MMFIQLYGYILYLLPSILPSYPMNHSEDFQCVTSNETILKISDYLPLKKYDSCLSESNLTNFNQLPHFFTKDSFPTEQKMFQIGNCYDLDTLKCYSNEPFPTVNFEMSKLLESNVSTSLYQSPLLADMNNDCIPEIIMSSLNNFNSNPRITSGINIVLTESGETLRNIQTAYYAWGGPTSYAVADVDSDGYPEIIIATADENANASALRRRLICYDAFGNVVWVSNTTYGNYAGGTQYGASPAFADFNQDGIPEVYIYNEVFNALNGVKLTDGGYAGLGSVITSFNSYAYATTIAADLDDNPNDLELAAGYTIYQVNIQNTTGLTGNSMTASNILVDNQLRDGFTSIADINQDGKLDVIVSSQGNSSTSRLYVYSLLSGSLTLLAQTAIPSPGNGCCGTHVGPAFVGDIDGSKKPTIGICRPYTLLTYKYDGTTILKEFWRISTNDESGSTGMTMFDFNQDGIQEIVYRDENTLRIINGSNSPPVNLTTFPCISGTGLEYPIVGDIDFSGESKICVPCGQNDFRTGRIHIFGAPRNKQKWAPSRGIWNQYTYHVHNITNQLTVPQFQNNNATYSNGRFNNFLVQASLLDTLGNFLQTATNLQGNISCLYYDPKLNVYTVQFNVSNLVSATASVTQGLTIAFFNGDPQKNGTLIGTYNISLPMPPGKELKGLKYTFSAIDLEELFLVINTNGLHLGMNYGPEQYLIGECDYSNNIITNAKIQLPEYQQVSLCLGDSLFFNGTWLKNSGEYSQIKVNVNGCDSIVELSLKVVDELVVNSTYFLCEGDSILIENNWIFKDEVISYKTISSLGCDSTRNYFITFSEPEKRIENIQLCRGDSIFLKNTWFTTNEIILDTITTLPCPIFITQNLFFSPTYTSKLEMTLCPGDSLLWYNQMIKDPGDYEASYQTISGCDSLFSLHVEQLSYPSEPSFTPDCDRQVYIGMVPPSLGWEFTWNSGNRENQVELNDTMVGFIDWISDTLECRYRFNFELVNIPDEDAILQLKDTIVYPGKPVKINIPVDSSYWNIKWTPSRMMACDSCFSNTIITYENVGIGLTLWHFSGCPYYFNFNVEVDNSLDIIIPNVFSPEANSPNNTWTWLIPDCFYVNTLFVYDRWGNLVFQLKNQDFMAWDGIFKGDFVEQGVYTFVAQYTKPDGSMTTKSGDVTFLRK